MNQSNFNDYFSTNYWFNQWKLIGLTVKNIFHWWISEKANHWFGQWKFDWFRFRENKISLKKFSSHWNVSGLISFKTKFSTLSVKKLDNIPNEKSKTFFWLITNSSNRLLLFLDAREDLFKVFSPMKISIRICRNFKKIIIRIIKEAIIRERRNKICFLFFFFYRVFLWKYEKFISE